MRLLRCASAARSPGIGSTEGASASYAPDGHCISLLKILLAISASRLRLLRNRSSSTCAAPATPSMRWWGSTLDYKRNYMGPVPLLGVIRSPDETIARWWNRAPAHDHSFGYIISRRSEAGDELIESRTLRRPPVDQCRAADRRGCAWPRKPETIRVSMANCAQNRGRPADPPTKRSSNCAGQPVDADDRRRRRSHVFANLTTSSALFRLQAPTRLLFRLQPDPDSSSALP